MIFEKCVQRVLFGVARVENLYVGRKAVEYILSIVIAFFYELSIPTEVLKRRIEVGSEFLLTL
jgi:hypothetical protein